MYDLKWVHQCSFYCFFLLFSFRVALDFKMPRFHWIFLYCVKSLWIYNHVCPKNQNSNPKNVPAVTNYFFIFLSRPLECIVPVVVNYVMIHDTSILAILRNDIYASLSIWWAIIPPCCTFWRSVSMHHFLFLLTRFKLVSVNDFRQVVFYF